MSQSHFPPSLGQQALNHHMDGNMLSISHSPPSAVDVTIGSADFTHPGVQRKFTLLSRPQQPLSGSSSLSPYQHSLPSTEQLNSAASVLNQQPVMSGSVQGRAARDDYYDTEDPSVNLQEFIVNSMQAQKNRIVLMKLEEEFVSYVSNPSRTEPLKLPSWDSYHRMLAHRVAAYFGLEHNVDPVDKTRVLVGKGPNTRMPKLRFGDYMSLNDDSESVEPKLILKRTSKESMDNFEAALVSVEPSSSDVKILKSYEQREEEYEKARAQIFNQQSPLQNTSVFPFDLATKSSQRMSSSIFPSSMHHRRAASDTSMFRRVGAAAELKRDASSSHSSRSATPLVNSLLKLGGSCELLSSSVNSRVQPPIQIQTSPKPSQQQRHSSVLESPPQAAHYFPQPSSSSSSDTLSKYDNTVPQHSNSLSTITAVAPGTVPVHYPHMQPSQPPLPLVYPQPPAALMADPNWYPYQQMMLYQLSPQGYVPTPAHYLSGGSHVIPGPAVYHPYSVAPGVIGQHAIVSSPPQQLAHPGAAVTRLPIGVDQLSPVHPNPGVSLVRPVPQQASPVRMAKVDASWNYSPHHQFGVQQPLHAQQIAVNPNSGQPAFTNIHQQVNASHLADQLDTSLHISNAGGEVHTPENEAEINHQRDMASKLNVNSKMKLVSYSEAGDGSEGDSSGFVGQVMPRMPPGNMNGSYPVGSISLSGIGDPALFGGQMISPTHPQGPVQYMQHQMQPPPVYGQDAGGYVNTQAVMPNNAMHFPPGTHSQPSTPTIGPLSLAPPGILQAQQQGIYSPPSSGITQSPIQILGHTLGTSLFSPPPSSGNHHGLFVNSPTSSGKVGFPPGAPGHPPVGSGTTRFRNFDSPKQSSGHVCEVSSSLSSQSGFQALPPRLAQQHGQKGGNNRYQNQRHPSNRVAVKTGGSAGPLTLGDHMPSQFVSAASGNTATKREPLLPTPPLMQVVKLDTNLTCGVPVHVMEVVGCAAEGTPERIQAFKAISDLAGLVDMKFGKMNKTGEEVVVAIFNSEETAMQALKIKHSVFTLSIPRNNHAKFILNLLQLQQVNH